jgi:hypothetical protein
LRFPHIVLPPRYVMSLHHDGGHCPEISTTGTEADTSTHTSDPKSARPQRIEVITRGERRRRWSLGEKQAIVAESLAPNASLTAVARRHVRASQTHGLPRGGRLLRLGVGHRAVDFGRGQGAGRDGVMVMSAFISTRLKQAERRAGRTQWRR